jgi:hypothetical protein
LNAKTLKLLRERDKDQCWHCGTTENLTVQHRANRGMGGSKKRDNPANLILLCWFVNFEMEASRVKAQIALRQGWKLLQTDRPEQVAAFHYPSGKWICLDDSWGYTVAE